MSETPDGDHVHPQANIFAQRVHMPRATLAFLLLNLADIVLTGALIADPLIDAYESNAVAAAWFERAGMPGMIALKCIMMIIIMIICELIYKYRPPVARRLLKALCVVVAVVVCYSVAIILKHHMVHALTASAAGPAP